MRNNICKKIKDYPLQDKVKVNYKDILLIRKRNILPTSYITGNKFLYDLDLDALYPILKKNLKQCKAEATISNKAGIGKAQIYVGLDRIEILSSYANKIKKIDSKYILQTVTAILTELLVFFTSNREPQNKKNKVRDSLASLKMHYTPKHVSFDSISLNSNLLEEIVKSAKRKVNIPTDFLENYYGIVKDFILLFFSIVLFVIDELKKMLNTYEKIEIVSNGVFYLSEFEIKKDGSLIWFFFIYFYVLKSARYKIDIKLVSTSNKVKKYTFGDFLKILLRKLMENISKETGPITISEKTTYILEMALFRSISLFILEYIISSIDLKLLLKHYLNPKTITLFITKTSNNVLEIRNGGGYLTFENYNTKFFDVDLVSLGKYRYVSIFLENGILSWSSVRNVSFIEKKDNIEDNLLFFMYDITTESFSIETYANIESILRVLDFLTGGHYDKSFLYELAFSFFRGAITSTYKN